MDDNDTQDRQPSARDIALFRVALPPVALVLWLLASRAFSIAGAAGVLQTTVLVAVLGWVFIAGAVDLSPSDVPPKEKRAIAWLLRTCLLVPCAAVFIWTVPTALLPGPVRSRGALPDLVALLGQRESTVARLLGTTQKPNARAARAPAVAMPPAVKAGTRHVVYGLPDLSSSARKKRGIQQLLQPLAPREEPESDARVVVYFSEDGRAVVAHLELPREQAAAVLGTEWVDLFPARAGLTSTVESVAAPAWAEAGTAQRKGDVERWGSSRLRARSVGFHLHSIKASPAGVRSEDAGFVSLTVGEGLLDPAPAAEALAPEDGSVAEAGDAAASASMEATRDFSDWTFYALILGQERTEAAARERADVLNQRAVAAGEASPAAAVEMSGHLQLGDEESYVIVYTIGYDSAADAWKRWRGLWWPLRAIPRVSKVMKRCGEFTFIDVE